jgi:hypothetical protein
MDMSSNAPTVDARTAPLADVRTTSEHPYNRGAKRSL